MTRYADPERCPDCLGAMPFGATTCPACGLSLDGPLPAKLFLTLSEADRILEQMRAAAPAAAQPVATPAGAAPAAVPVQALPTRTAPATGFAGVAPPPVTGPAHLPHAHLSASSVPKILLGLGAICVLIAAMVFLAVTWSVMGVAGRTATLVGFTVVTGGLATWVARRGLRAAAESLTVVALGLLAFDLFGARDSGWFGEMTDAGFLVLLGAALAAAGTSAAVAVRRTKTPALVGAELVAALGLLSVAGGITQAAWVTDAAGLTVSVVLFAGATRAAYSVRLPALTTAAAALGGGAWVLLVLTGWDRALTHPSVRELWLELEVWPLVAGALLVSTLALARALPVLARVTALAIGEALLATAVLAPVSDETVTAASLVVVAVLVVTGALAWFVPAPWDRGVAVTVALAGVWTTVLAMALATTALDRLVSSGSMVWQGAAGDLLPRAADTLPGAPASWLLLVAAAASVAALVVLARAYPGAGRLSAPLLNPDLLAGVAAAAGIATLALYAVSVWLVLALLLSVACGFAVRALSGQHALALALAIGYLALGVVLSLHAETLTLAALLVGLVLTTAVHLRWAGLDVSATAGALLAASVAGLTWTVGALADAAWSWTALTGLLLLAVLVLATPYVDTRLRVAGPATYARLGIELGALAAALGLSAGGLDMAAAARTATWAAVYLTITGAAVSAMALLRPDRRMAGWLGGGLLAAASWVRLWDIGVEAPEAYTLPTAVALAVVGVVHLRRDPEATTMTALSPALSLALVPSLLWVLADPVTLRSLLLGLACLALVLVGVKLRWTAPVVFASTVGALLVLRHATPMAEAVPRWMLIGLAGALLISMGITWENRLREARAMLGYVRHLR
ncbi:hypothetical protein K1X13_08430 [Nocardioides sp. WL0053]|uniref:DUF2157 domain-containing protein n=1 Tax=Nocardioides jiangsuensis TaxID=2866161 RepID=A0ABS7RK34_9ACTN|nr:hypothetical protein [Nocardioides jiangsuensis]MBY9074844.1 hypothetical protein [Nocardioides jiangsuensis]